LDPDGNGVSQRSGDPVRRAVDKRGWGEVAPAFEFLTSRFSNGTRYDYEVIGAGASGDIVYFVGTEHSVASVGGATPEAIDLRVTTICRREDGEWKIVHRHADPLPDSDATRRQLTRFLGSSGDGDSQAPRSR
jgi:ketosteroid isomerase-like protein